MSTQYPNWYIVVPTLIYSGLQGQTIQVLKFLDLAQGTPHISVTPGSTKSKLCKRFFGWGFPCSVFHNGSGLGAELVPSLVCDSHGKGISCSNPKNDRKIWPRWPFRNGHIIHGEDFLKFNEKYCKFHQVMIQFQISQFITISFFLWKDFFYH